MKARPIIFSAEMVRPDGSREMLPLAYEPDAHTIEGLKLEDVQHIESRIIISARDSYASLWERINGTGSWQRNPWVWAITFKKVTL